MKKFISLIIPLVIIIATLFCFTSVFAEEKTEDIVFNWNSYENKGRYNSADKGKDISFAYTLLFDGKDEKGNLHKNIESKSMIYKGKIGENSRVSVPVDEITGKDNKKYTDCDIIQVSILVYEGNRIYGGNVVTVGNGLTGIEFIQNMETLTNKVVEPGAIILKSDKNNIDVSFSVEGIKDGKSTYPLKNNNLRPIEKKVKFVEGKEILALDGAFKSAVEQNKLDQFSPYRPNSRMRELKLHADFTGENKASLDKKYKLSVSGDDLKGWTVTLSSKIKKNVKEKTEELDFKTIYKKDPTLLKGKTKVKQEGVKGISKTKTAYYYIVGEDGKEEILEEEEPVTEIVEPVDEIILEGTKVAANNGDSNKPGTGDMNHVYLYVAILVISMAIAATLIIRKRIKNK